MAVKPVVQALPGDLPEDWALEQVVSPNGTEAGLDERHGYNYQSRQINAAQRAVNVINEAFSSLAELGSDGKVPPGQLPSLDYVPIAEKGQAGGVATLGGDGRVPAGQLPQVVAKCCKVDFTAADWVNGTITVPKSRHGLSGGALICEAKMLVGGGLTPGTWAAMGTYITVNESTLEVVIHSADAYTGCVVLIG